MKKVLVLSGSPRKGGNSDTLCDQFIKGVTEAGHTAEKIYVDDHKIGFCKACYACKKEGVCFQEDDMSVILDKMVEADIIVMPMVLYSFLESVDLSGKTIVPFNTNGGSGFSDTIDTIAKLQPNAAVERNGFEVSRDIVQNAESDVAAWLRELGYYNAGSNSSVTPA